MDWLGAAARHPGEAVCCAAAAAFGVFVAASMLPSKAQAKAQTHNGFDTFLREKIPRSAVPDPPKRQVATPAGGRNGFESFLRKGAPPRPADARPRRAPDLDHKNAFDRFVRPAEPGAGRESPAAADDGPPDDGKPRVGVLVCYGTEYGFAREIAHKVVASLRGVGAGASYRPRLLDMADYSPETGLGPERALLFVCSTQGDGVPPAEARRYFDWAASPGAPPLGGSHFAVCALGDTSYTHFCRAGKTLDARLETLGGRRVTPRVDIDREDWAAVDAWITGSITAIGGLKLPATVAVPVSPPAANGHVGTSPSKKRPWFARLVARRGLCVLDGPDDKDTVMCEFDIAGCGASYAPGDALGVCGTNAPADVDELLAALGASGSEDVPVPTWHYVGGPPSSAPPGRLSLRDALSSCYDLRECKTPAMAQLLLAALPLDAPGRDALSSLVGGPVAALEAYAAQRWVADMMREASGGRAIQGLSTLGVLSAMRPLAPRLYSISSSPLENPGTVQITVAAVRYTATATGRPRVGVCSTHVCERMAVGESVGVYIHENPDFRLPASPTVPVVMVGPGTGLAPFRSFLLHRWLAGGPAPSAPPMLFFGCRRRDRDYLYGPQLDGWARESKLTLHLAFSRQDPASKVYVQDRLMQQAEAVWRLLRAGAHFYVCGDANKMAGDVEAALLTIMATQGKLGAAGAKALLQQMADGGRYQRDVWFS